MSWLDSIERLAEHVVEGPSRALFRPRLEPVQVAKAAARALAESESIGPSGPQVANAYRIRLSPRDFSRFGGFQRTLAEQVLGYLDEHARDRGLRPAAAWRVQLLSDPRIRLGYVKVDAQYADRPTRSASRPTAVAARSDVDAVPVAPRHEPSAPLSPPPRPGTAWLHLETGERIPLGTPLTALGRALDNTVPIQDPRVSRFHAQIESFDDRFLVRDLESTNGTFVGGDRVATDRPLTDGDEISLGGFVAVFHGARPT